MPVLQLKGCHYEPLGDYLKALGIFRLIAEQLDPTARCWWKDGIFHLWLNGDAFYPLDGCTRSRLRSLSNLKFQIPLPCRLLSNPLPLPSGRPISHLGFPVSSFPRFRVS